MDCSTSDVVVTVTGFRETFPEFVNDVAYPAYMIEPLLTLNKQLVNQARFGDLTAYMIYLRTAHMLVIQKQSMNAAARGGVPGMSVGPMSSKGAEGMSASYEVGAVMEDGAGWWNGTVYGRMWWSYKNLFGAGPMQVGGPGPAVLTAWPGPGGFFPV